MSLTRGARLGVYEVVGLLEAGGMGEVWRATDTQLHRDVALEILPEAFAAEADRLTWFERKAHVRASLNHPNIAQIHGLEGRDDRAIQWAAGRAASVTATCLFRLASSDAPWPEAMQGKGATR